MLDFKRPAISPCKECLAESDDGRRNCKIKELPLPIPCVWGKNRIHNDLFDAYAYAANSLFKF